MRLDRLDLLAWGSFEQTPLPLDGGEFGLHIVYGPNEAGKSTALRGLLALLFGALAKNVLDDHRHNRNDLRVAADLRDASGKLVRVVRRVGDPRKSLRDGSDKNVVDSFWLQPGEYDDEEFRRRLVFGYDDFVQGGRAMLEGGGEVGQTLFSAAAGLGNLSAVRQQLDAESEDLFKPRASKPKLNEAISQLTECRARLGKLVLKESEFSAQAEELQRAVAAKQAAEDALSQLEHRQRELESRLQALPDLAQRDDLRGELAELSDAPLLAADFDKNRITIRRDLVLRKAEVDRLTQLGGELRQQLSGLLASDPLLTHTETVRFLIKESGKISKSLADRPRLAAEHREKEKALRQQLAELPAGAAEIRIPRHDRDQLRKLDADRTRLGDQIELFTNQLETEQQALGELEADLAGLPVAAPPVELVSLARNARGAAEREQAISALEGKIAAETRALEALLRPLQLAVSGAELPHLNAPSSETLEDHRDRRSQREQAVSQANDRVAQFERDRAGMQAELARRVADQTPPTVEEVAAARRERDAAWRMLRLRMAGQQPHPVELQTLLQQSGAEDLPAAFEHWGRLADAAADRLYREAAVVARHAEWRAQYDKLAAQLTAAREQAVREQAASAAENEAWIGLWRPLGVSPGSPKEMLAWRRKLAEAQQKALAITELTREGAQAQQSLALLRGQLLAALATLETAETHSTPEPHSQPVSLLADRLAAATESRTRAAERRAEMADRLRQSQRKADARARDLSRLREQAAECEKTWKAIASQLPAGLGDEPRSLFRVLDALDDIAAKQQDLADKDRRISGMERDVREFAEQVRLVVQAAAPALLGLEPGPTVDQLDRKLQAAQQVEARRKDLAARLAEAEAEFTRETGARDACLALLAQLCREARCENPDDLDRRVDESNRRRAAERELKETEDRLRRLAGGMSLDDFARSAREASEADLHEALRRLRTEIQEHKDARDVALQLRSTASRELARMKGDGSAAEAEEEAQSQLAHIRGLAERFIRLRLAGAVLEQAITRHQQANEMPILKQAGAIFARLTLGSFSELRTGHNDAGDAILVGIREGNKEVQVDWMSDGARDQLFLALRLASLELFLKEREPIPFIVDDILINFDDARSLAALQVLAELARKTQVILFTHHEHLTQLAERNLPPGELFVHRLP